MATDKPVFLFPGQGSQTPGMGQDLYEMAALRSYFDQAEAAVPGLLEAMFNGPAETLSQTQLAQPALFTVGAALSAALGERGVTPTCCAGHSLGEFTALHASGALTFEEALRLVAARGRCMSQEVPEGTMAAVMGLDPEAIEAALPEGATVANYNGPQQTIITGSKAAIAAADEALKAAGAKRVLPLAVSGPFHSPLMEGAAKAFQTELAEAAIQAPVYPFVSSVTGGETSDPEKIRELLTKQICAPVRWTAVMETIGPASALELGPGRVLQGLAKRMPNGPDITCVGTVEALNALEER